MGRALVIVGVTSPNGVHVKFNAAMVVSVENHPSDAGVAIIELTSGDPVYAACFDQGPDGTKVPAADPAHAIAQQLTIAADTRERQIEQQMIAVYAEAQRRANRTIVPPPGGWS